MSTSAPSRSPRARWPAGRGWAVAAFVAVALAPQAQAQGFTGPDRCQKCHKKLATPSFKHHRDAGAQLDPAKKPNAAVYAAATGGDPKAAACRRCHAPDAASAPATVTCETCHGPGKGYLDPHQERPFYDGANLMGLVVLYNQPAKVAKLCTGCHVLGAEHKAIADLGHPTGDTFKASAALEKMKHWPSADEKDVRPRAYAAPFLAEVDKAAAPELQKALKAKRGPAPAGGPKPGAGGAAAGAPPASGAGAGGAKPSGTAAPEAQAAAPAAGTAGVLGQLLADLRQEGVDVRSSNLPDAPAARFVRTALPPRRTAPAPPPPSTTPPGTTPEGPAAEEKLVESTTRESPAKDVAELRGRAIARLAAMLRARKKIELSAPAAPARFAGPNGELLSLQDEALVLALQTLSKEKQP